MLGVGTWCPLVTPAPGTGTNDRKGLSAACRLRQAIALTALRSVVRFHLALP